MNKSLVVLALVTAACCGSAHAQSPAYTWTGCYIGANAGGGWDRNDGAQPRSFFEYTSTADGFAGGGQLGCDYQFANNFVIGVQGLWEWSSLRGQTANAGSPPDIFKTKVDEFGSLTARLGYLINPATLIYVKGGIGNVQTRFDNVDRGGGFGAPLLTDEHKLAASVFGGGMEWMFAPQWTMSIDYEHYDTGREHFLVAAPGNAFEEHIRQRLDKVTIGLNYRFGAR